MNRHIGFPKRKIVTLPDWTFALAGRKIMADQKAKNQEGGLNIVRYTKLQSANLFIDKSLGSEPLGVEPDDMDSAIGDSVKLCLDVIQHRVQTVGMKAE